MPSSQDQSPTNKITGHVLVVDDEPLTVEAVCSLLRLDGLEATGVYSGPEAIDFLKSSLQPNVKDVDLVLLDWFMPGMSGLSVCRWIKEHYRFSHLPVILLTASNTANAKVVGLDSGANDFVTKPYHSGELLARIRALLRTYRIEQALSERGRQLAALNQIATAITSSMELDEILSTTLQGMRNLLNVEIGSLFLLHPAGDRLRLRKSLAKSREWTSAHEVPLGQGLVGHAAASRHPILANEAPTHPHYHSNYDTAAETAVESALVVPLMVKGSLIGVLEAINKVGGPFSQDDLDLLLSMAGSVAVALDNARLFNDLHAAYRQVEANRKELQSTASTLQALFDGITDGLYIVDHNWKLVAVNRGRAKQPGAWPDQLVNRICFRALHGRQTPCPTCQVAQTLESGVRGHWSEQQRPASHVLNEWELFSYPIFGQGGQVSQAIVLRRDITEQSSLEASLAQAEKLAAVGQLAAGIAHEINNPLTAIIANTQFLLEDIDSKQDAYQSVELIAQAGERAARVVRNLLDFARQEDVEPRLLDVNESLREVLSLLAPQLNAAGVQVTTRLAPALSPIFAHADHLHSIWFNLLKNAQDAVSSLNTSGRIDVVSRQMDDVIQVSIVDNGQGIPADELGQIFHPFYTTKEPGKGTGLGLSISYRLAAQYGGTIKAISDLDHGTAFLIQFPIRPAQSE